MAFEEWLDSWGVISFLVGITFRTIDHNSHNWIVQKKKTLIIGILSHFSLKLIGFIRKFDTLKSEFEEVELQGFSKLQFEDLVFV